MGGGIFPNALTSLRKSSTFGFNLRSFETAASTVSVLNKMSLRSLCTPSSASPIEFSPPTRMLEKRCPHPDVNWRAPGSMTVVGERALLMRRCCLGQSRTMPCQRFRAERAHVASSCEILARAWFIARLRPSDDIHRPGPRHRQHLANAGSQSLPRRRAPVDANG
jgi:hypothetical protein